MPNAFENLRKTAFDGIEFPIESIKVKGGLRFHVHEYPHVPGGDAEKLGRRLYEIEIVGNFELKSLALAAIFTATWRATVL